MSESLHNNDLPHHLVASSVGGTVTAIAVCPLDVVKTRLQAQPNPCNRWAFHPSWVEMHAGYQPPPCPPAFQARSSLEAFYLIIRYEGLRVLWRGLTPTLFMTVPGVTLYFTLYEQFSRLFGTPSLAGACARIISVLFTSPFEMLRTYAQAKPQSQGLLTVLPRLVKVQGLSGLYIGVGPTLLRDVPFSAIYWPVFERVRVKLEKRNPNSSPFNTSFLSGAMAGSIAAVLATPADVLKTRMQMSIDSLDQKEIKPQFSRVIAELLHKEGFRGFFRGVTPRVFRIAPACALMISSYDYCKKLLQDFSK